MYRSHIKPGEPFQNSRYHNKAHFRNIHQYWELPYRDGGSHHHPPGWWRHTLPISHRKRIKSTPQHVAEKTRLFPTVRFRLPREHSEQRVGELCPQRSQQLALFGYVLDHPLVCRLQPFRNYLPPAPKNNRNVSVLESGMVRERRQTLTTQTITITCTSESTERKIRKQECGVLESGMV